MNTKAIVMAAGRGTRMKSQLPKVLHPVCGRPLLYFSVRAALDLGADQVVVVVNPETRDAISAALDECFPDEPVTLAQQDVPQGTGDAARAGMAAIEARADDPVLVLSADTPLICADELAQAVGALGNGVLGDGAPGNGALGDRKLGATVSLSVMSFIADDPTGYGRILRDNTGRIREIREHKDLRSDAERGVCEVNGGLYAVRAGALQKALERLSPDNAQGEYYLTDIVALLSEEAAVQSVQVGKERLAGVNDRGQLNEVETVLFERIRQRHGRAGVSLIGQPLIDDTVLLADNVRIECAVRLRGKTEVGPGCFIDVGSVIDDSSIGAGTHVKPHCVITDSRVGAHAQIGPFAHLRPASIIEDEAHLGNFVETKKTIVRRGAKANHLAYLGDADIGERSNLGAGTIICNYDGYRKQRTIIGRGVFVGSDSQLVAPVRVGDGAYVATATTVTQDVPEDALAVGRVRQTNKPGYAPRLKARLKAQAEAAKSSPASETERQPDRANEPKPSR